MDNSNSDFPNGYGGHAVSQNGQQTAPQGHDPNVQGPHRQVSPPPPPQGGAVPQSSGGPQQNPHSQLPPQRPQDLLLSQGATRPQNTRSYEAQPDTRGHPAHQGGRRVQPVENTTVYADMPSPYQNHGPPAHIRLYDSSKAKADQSLLLALFTTFCCFMPVGLLALMRACDSRSALATNDREASETLAKESKRLSLLALTFGFGLMVAASIVVALHYA